MIENNDLIDAIGIYHQAISSPPRIACLVPSITELLFALQLGDYVVARTSYCIHPQQQLARIPSVGGTKKIKHRLLRDLKATHVIVNIDENTKELAEKLSDYVPVTVVTHPLQPQDNLALYRLLGGIFNQQQAAEALCQQFIQALQAITAGSPRQVLYLIWRKPWMTISRDTYIARMLGLFNWHTVPVHSEQRYPTLEMADFLAQENPDLVLFSSEPYAFSEQDLQKFADEYDYPLARTALINGEMTSWYGSRAISGLGYLTEFVRRYQV